MWKRRDNVEKPSPSASARLSSPLTQCGRRTGFFRALISNNCGSSSFVNNFLQETAECPPIPISERTTDGRQGRERERGAAYLRRLWASPAVAAGDGRTDGSSARRRRRRRTGPCATSTSRAQINATNERHARSLLVLPRCRIQYRSYLTLSPSSALQVGREMGEKRCRDVNLYESY